MTNLTFPGFRACSVCPPEDQCEEQYIIETGAILDGCALERNTMNEQPIAMDIYERKEMNANGEGGSVWNDLSHALETGDYQEFEDYFGDEDPFAYL